MIKSIILDNYGRIDQMSIGAETEKRWSVGIRHELTLIKYFRQPSQAIIFYGSGGNNFIKNLTFIVTDSK